jgi:hypothetical protein
MPYAYSAGDPFQQTDPLGLVPQDTQASGQSVVSGITGAIGNVASGIVYSLNPANWDDIYRNVRCGALTDGWVASVNMNLNPMYGVVANVDAAIGAAQDGRWGDFAEHTTEAAIVTALVFAGAKAVVKSLARTTKPAQAATGKVPNVTTGPKATAEVKAGTGATGAGQTATSASRAGSTARGGGAKATAANAEGRVFSNLAPGDAVRPQGFQPINPSSLTNASGRYNYVVSTNGRLVLGNRRYGHIDLANGGDVLAAGEVRVVNGQVVSINNASGHYQPFGPSAQAAAEQAFGSSGLPVRPGAYTEVMP